AIQVEKPFRVCHGHRADDGADRSDYLTTNVVTEYPAQPVPAASAGICDESGRSRRTLLLCANWPLFAFESWLLGSPPGGSSSHNLSNEWLRESVKRLVPRAGIEPARRSRGPGF